ncbi:MAG TPA: phosphoribosylformylglycinamidine synthase subunit PurS [Longimicrobiales bacterium]
MTEYMIEVHVTPRAGILDPQGKAVQHALQSLEFADVEDVRVGRLIRVRMKATSPADARARVDDMCRRLLANPVTEDYSITVGAQ